MGRQLGLQFFSPPNTMSINNSMRARLFLTVIVLVGCTARPKENLRAKECAEYAANSLKLLSVFGGTKNQDSLVAALTYIDRGIQCDSNKLSNYWIKLVILNQMKKYSAAIDLINTMSNNSSSPELLLSKGQIFESMDNMDSAIFFYDRTLMKYDELLTLNPANSSVIIAKINAVNLSKGPKQAILALNDFLIRYPEKIELRKYLDMLRDTLNIQRASPLDLPDSLR